MRPTLFTSAVLVATLGCSNRADRPEPAPTGAVSPMPAYQVGVGSGRDTYRGAGAVRAVRRASLATRMMARVESIRVRAGDRVRSGQVLATLEKGAVVAAGSQAAAGLDLATTNLRRMERLYADSAIPVAQLEGARAAFEQARGHADAASAELGYASLVAPFDGVITARNADPGDLAAPGQPVLVVEDLGAREIVIGVPEPVAAGLVIGGTVRVLIGADEKVVTARIATVVPSADPVSRTVEVRLTTPTPLTPGVTAIAEFPMAGRPTGDLVIPVGAVVRRGELAGVFLVQSDSTARLRWIRLGRTVGTGVMVASGLAAGDVVLTHPADVKDGARVRAVIGQETWR